MEQTDSCQKEGGRKWGQEGEELVKEQMCVAPGHRHQCHDSQREREAELGGDGQSGGNGDICSSVSNRNKVKK